MRTLLLSPHHDDETLFAAFTIIRERPDVAIVYGATDVRFGSSIDRQRETSEATTILGANSVTFFELDLPMDEKLRAVLRSYDDGLYEQIYAPSWCCTHRDHRQLARAAADVFRGRLTAYHTYEHRPPLAAARVRSDTPVAYEPEWVHRKLNALARYQTQASHPLICSLFLDDQREYYDEDIR